MFKLLNRFKYFDIPLQVSIFLLSIAGLALLYSISVSGDDTSIFWRQVLFFGLGLLGFIFFSFFDYHTLAKANKIIYVVFIVLLLY